MKYLKILGIDETFIISKIEERKNAKKSNDYELADSIRAELDGKGIILSDTREGTNLDIKLLF